MISVFSSSVYCKNTVYNMQINYTYVNRLFMLSVGLPVNSRLLSFLVVEGSSN